MMCYLASYLNCAILWLYAGNHVEPEEDMHFTTLDSDLP